MSEVHTFWPPRRWGFFYHLALGLLLAALVGAGTWAAWRANPGLPQISYSLLAILALFSLPATAYRLYALQTARYALEQDGIHLRWGLRLEDIPMDEVLWVLPAAEISGKLPLPWLRWPGAVAGVRRLPQEATSGGPAVIEYMAATRRSLVLIGTTSRVFAISPADPAAFLHTYQRLTELGSFYPLPRRSVQPTFLFSQVWANLPARFLISGGLLLSLALFVVVGLATPGLPVVHLGFQPGGLPGDAVEPVRLFLLPTLSAFFFGLNLLAGLFLFRRKDDQPLSYLLWGGGVLTPLLFLAGVAWILASS